MPSFMPHHRKAVIAATLALIAGGFAIPFLTDCEVCDAANTILLRGTVAQNCTIAVNPGAAALTLPLAEAGAKRIQVGTVSQNCNKKTGYTLTVESLNCSQAPAGGKVIDGVSGEYLAYSGEFANPTTGGSQASVTNLLAANCASQVGRDVTNAKVTGEISTVYVNFTGNPSLAAGTYTDTLTISMNVK